MVRAVNACRRMRRRSSGRGGFTLIELLVVMSIMMILAGLITSAVFIFKRMVMKKGAMVDISNFTIGLAQYKRDLGSYPPDDITDWGGTPEHGRNEVIHYYLGRRHLKGANFYGPYVTFKVDRLTDLDGDGFKEYPDPFGGYYEYGLVKDLDGNVVRYEIVSSGHDQDMGGQWDTAGDQGDVDVVGEFVIDDEAAARDNASFGSN